MKAETKAKRRVTLSLSGLGLIDESEVSSIPDAQPAEVGEDGVIKAQPVGLAQLVAARVEAIAPTETIADPGELEDVAEEDDGETEDALLAEAAAAATTAPEPAGPPEADEPEASDDQDEAPILASPMDRFASWSVDHDREVIKAATRALFPGIKSFNELGADQLEQIIRAVEDSEDGPGDDAVSDEPEVVNEAGTPLCGARSPLSESVCTLDPGHRLPHRAGLKESW
jgi:hypothetical protein